ncbi:hypothetical protein ACLBWS_18595, partial [Brucellaceae bacterium D45D]
SRACHCLVTVATNSSGHRKTSTYQIKNATVMLDASLIDCALLDSLLDTMTVHVANIVFPDDVTLRSIRELKRRDVFQTSRRMKWSA